MDDYPRNLVEQYLKASNKLKKFDRQIFKRFAPNVIEIQDEFSRLAAKFETADIHPYAAMCHLGVAKCEVFIGNAVIECNAYLKAARAFQRALATTQELQPRSNRGEYKDGALRCYTLALERITDNSVMKAAIIQEMSPLQHHFEGTSNFASPPHQIHELELSAKSNVRQQDFLSALHALDDIVDNICERKKQDLYEEVLARVEILRLLLLIVLNLSPARQSPAHIKLIEFYYDHGSKLHSDADAVAGCRSSSDFSPGSYLGESIKMALVDIVVLWCKQMNGLLPAVAELAMNFTSLNDDHRLVIDYIVNHSFVN